MHIGNWGKTLLDELRSQGFSDQSIVGNTGINIARLDDEDPMIGFEKLALLFERAADMTGNDLIGFEHGQNSDYRNGGLFSYTGVSSASVRTLLKNLARFQRVTGDVLRINADLLDTKGEIAWHFDVPRDVLRRQYVEFSSALLLGILRRLTDRRITPITVEFRHFRKSNTDAFETFHGCDVSFGAPDNRVKLKLLDLDLPLKSADDKLHRILEKVSQEALEKSKPSTPQVVSDVEECIAKSPGITQSEVAKALGMSVRTLARRLSEAGTTYVDVLDGYRLNLAKNMLTETDFQLTEIAYVLGYADPSTFSTAFRRWTDQTPSAYRDRYAN